MTFLLLLCDLIEVGQGREGIGNRIDRYATVLFGREVRRRFN